MIDSTRRRILLASSAAVAGTLLPRISTAQQRIVMNDASRLSATPVFSHWVVKPDPEEQLIAALRKELKTAASRKRPVAVGAARHSMGGQSLPRNGNAITFDIVRCEPDRAAHTFRVHAGTRWHQVIDALDRIGESRPP